MVRALRALLDIIMPPFAIIGIFILLCEVLMNIYCKIYDYNSYDFDHTENTKWTTITFLTIFFMPAASKTICMILLTLAVVNSILLFSFYRKTDKYKNSKKIEKVLIVFTTVCLYCSAMIISCFK